VKRLIHMPDRVPQASLPRDVAALQQQLLVGKRASLLQLAACACTGAQVISFALWRPPQNRTACPSMARTKHALPAMPCGCTAKPPLTLCMPRALCPTS
jgi:hypothetical protein